MRRARSGSYTHESRVAKQVSHRPTPREGWTVPAEFREDAPGAGTPVLKPVPTSADATLSFAELKPAPVAAAARKPGEDDTISLADTPAHVYVAPQGAPRKPTAPMLATGLPAPGKRASATLFGLPTPKLGGVPQSGQANVQPAAVDVALPAQTSDALSVLQPSFGEPERDAHAVLRMPQAQLGFDERTESRPPSALRRKSPWRHAVWAGPIAFAGIFLWLRAPAGDAAEGSIALPESASAAFASQAEKTAEEQASPVTQAATAQAPEPAMAPEAAEVQGQAADEVDDDATDTETDTTRKAAAAKADKLIDEGHALRKKGKLGPARNKYRAALNAYPNYPRAMAGLLQLAIQQRDGKQAVNLAKQLVQQRPSQLSYQVLLGDAYKVQGKTALARETWQVAARKGSAQARARLRK